MKGTFKPGDNLFVNSIFLKKLNKGDILVIKSQDSKLIDKKLVHRIVNKSDNTSITRGDNNPQNDDEPVTEENLIGKVTYYERKGKIHKVCNGRIGLIWARVLHGRLHIIRAMKFFLRKPYRLLKKTGIIARLWRPKIETIYFETQDGPLVKYIHKDRTVASCWVDSKRWWFRRPYDFVIGPKVK
ncbi:MAG: signal peptidase I [Candidatus Aminicenantes bacterium]|nr:signal peptidase I [Candidatus Aminicenantes bacterium]